MPTIDFLPIIKHSLIAVSNIFGLKAGRVQNNGIKILLNGIENLTKFLAFSNLEIKNLNIKNSDIENLDIKNITTESIKSIKNVIAFSAMTTLDDIAINYDLYQSHHLTKFGSALYVGQKLSVQDGNPFATIAISGGLLVASYLFGSSDMINVIRANTNDVVEFADDISNLSDGIVNIDNDIITSHAISNTLSCGAQYLKMNHYEIGGSLNVIMNTTTNTFVNIISSAASEQEFKKILLNKFQHKLKYLSTEQINRLDYRAQHVLENLPKYIEQAYSSITKNAINTSIKTAYQNILAQDKQSLDIFIVANLFNCAPINNIEAKVSKNIKSIQDDYNYSKLSQYDKLYEIEKKLRIIKDKEDYSVTTKLWDYSKKVFKVLIPSLICGILLHKMLDHEKTDHEKTDHEKTDHEKTDHEKTDHKKTDPLSIIASRVKSFWPILSIGETFIDIDSFTAIKQLEYLEYALEELPNIENNHDEYIDYTQYSNI
jgi:hypothetical protein